VKFTRQEKIITTISCQEISNLEEVRYLLQDLKKEHLKFSLIMRNIFKGENDSSVMQYKNSTVKKVNDTNAEFFIFNQSGSINMKIDLENIIEIKALTGRNDFLKYGKKITKFDVMDI